MGQIMSNGHVKGPPQKFYVTTFENFGFDRARNGDPDTESGATKAGKQGFCCVIPGPGHYACLSSGLRASGMF